MDQKKLSLSIDCFKSPHADLTKVNLFIEHALSFALRLDPGAVQGKWLMLVEY